MATTCSPIVRTPGTAGTNGTNGTNGATGQNAHTTVNGQFLMPAEGVSVVVNVINSNWMVVGQNYAVEGAGTMRLSAIGSSTQITLLNIENTALGLYTGNVAGGTAIPDGSDIGIGGVQGNTGAVAAGALIAANNLSDVPSAVAAQANLGLGSAALRNAGNAINQVPFVDPAGALVVGRSVWATATGLETKTQPLALAALGVILGVSITNVPPATANLVAGDALFATATGLESKPAAAARTALGISLTTGLAFKANKNAVVQAAIGSGVQTKLTFVELFDPDAVFDDALDRFIPGVVNAVVQIHASIEWLAGIAGAAISRVYIYKNGAAFAERYVPVASMAVASMIDITVSDQPALTTDYYEVFVQQDSGNVQGITGDITRTFFEGHRIG